IASLPSTGTAVLNADDEYVSQFGRNSKGKVVMYGIESAADVRAEKVEQRGPSGSAFDLVINGRHHRATLPLVGMHNVSNALAAVSVGLQLGLTATDVVSALSTLSPADKRGQVVQLGNITVINDCYNSNPTALNAMVDALMAMPAKRHIVVAGEMLELGPTGEELHRKSGQHMASKKVDILLGVRGLAQAAVEGAKSGGVRAEFVASPEEAADRLARETRDEDVVLLKASRGVKLEKALEKWKSLFELSAAQKVSR